MPRLIRIMHFAFIIVVARGCTLAAQTAPDTTTTVIHAGRFFDSENGIMLAARTIIIKGARITAVGEKLAVPPGAREIDLHDLTVLPGLIDGHTHLLYLEDPSSNLTMEGIKAVAVEGTALRALHGAARARTFLAAGIMCVNSSAKKRSMRL